MNDYGEVERLVDHQMALERTVAELTLRLAGFQRALHEVKEIAVPEAVDGLEWDVDRMELDERGDRITLTLPSGTRIHIQDSFHPSISKINQQQAFAWIKRNGGEALLSTDVTLSFRRDESDKVVATLDTLAKLDPERTINVKPEIHHATLKKFCRDKIMEGIDVPETLGVFNRREATIQTHKTLQVPLADTHEVYG